MTSSVPTLGWVVLAWLMRHLPSPRDETQPYHPADWQARRTLRWYELERSGKRRWNRCHDEDPKGKGKSPHAAATVIAEFRGPVVFDGWAKAGDFYACKPNGCRCGWVYSYERGEPKGKPWGSPGLPSPWIQVAAVSEAQTANTWAALHAFLAANKGRLADLLGLDAGRTLVYWRDRVDAKVERVTSSAASRTGQPITHAVMDEPQEQTPELRGPDLAKTILENLTKLDGWAHFTGNAPVIGRDSVAELLGAPAPRALHMGPRPSIEPREDMTRDEMRPLILEVYEGTPWTPVERILDDIADRAAHPWPDSRRLFFNVPWDSHEETRWMQPDDWAACSGDVTFDKAVPVFARVQIAHDHRSAAVALAQRQGDSVALRVRSFDVGDLDEYVSATELEQHVAALRRRYPARVLAARRVIPRGKERLLPAPGPEVSYHGAFFEGSAQRLTDGGVVMVDIPNSQERLAPAAETLMNLVIDGRLVHDGGDELARQVDAVVAAPADKGWRIQPPSDTRDRIVAALAAMHAVHRALTAPRPQSRAMHRGVAPR